MIQTQTPISPGNSGGPLLSNNGDLIGVNSFKAKGEGLNFAVSVGAVKRFLARPTNRLAEKVPSVSLANCKTTRRLGRFRNKENNATIVAFDIFCTGKDNDEKVIPDDPTKAIFYKIDRNGDGRPDLILFDLKRRGRIDMSWYDNNFSGHWTLVGFYDNGRKHQLDSRALLHINDS